MNVPTQSTLDFDQWKELMGSYCGLNQGTAPKAFSGWVRPRSVCGFEALELGHNVFCVERERRGALRNDWDHYCALIALAGRITFSQNDRIAALDVGDIALLDSSQPVRFEGAGDRGELLALILPRRSLISHVGLEPQGGLRAPAGSLPARLMLQLVKDVEALPAPAEPYMSLTIYDLLGALFGGVDPSPFSPHTDKLFTRVRNIIKARFTDPDLGACEVAEEAGISLRYLQKLFTARGSTCTHFIRSLRLDHASRLLRRRTLLHTGQSLSEIAYTCGFRDYSHLARAFRQRFGHSPGETESPSGP